MSNYSVIGLANIKMKYTLIFILLTVTAAAAKCKLGFFIIVPRALIVLFWYFDDAAEERLAKNHWNHWREWLFCQSITFYWITKHKRKRPNCFLRLSSILSNHYFKKKEKGWGWDFFWLEFYEIIFKTKLNSTSIWYLI